jgi:hypothetical protein
MNKKIKRLTKVLTSGPWGQIVVINYMPEGEVRIEYRLNHYTYMTNLATKFFLEGWKLLSTEDK